MDPVRTPEALSLEAVEAATALREITLFLMEKYGPLMTKKDLVKVLGYASEEAFERSLQRQSLDLKLVRLHNRRGVFAMSRDVAAFLVGISRDAEVSRVKQRGDAQ